MFRGSDNSNLQNPGFFPMTWVGVNWQGTGPISGRATACISCHNEITSRLELVDAVARVDLTKCLDSFFAIAVASIICRHRSKRGGSLFLLAPSTSR